MGPISHNYCIPYVLHDVTFPVIEVMSVEYKQRDGLRRDVCLRNEEREGTPDSDTGMKLQTALLSHPVTYRGAVEVSKKTAGTQ